MKSKKNRGRKGKFLIKCLENKIQNTIIQVIYRVWCSCPPKSVLNGLRSKTQFIVPDWGDKVDNGKELSYQPVRLHRLAGRYDNLYHNRHYTPVRDYYPLNLAKGHVIIYINPWIMPVFKLFYYVWRYVEESLPHRNSDQAWPQEQSPGNTQGHHWAGTSGSNIYVYFEP